MYLPRCGDDGLESTTGFPVFKFTFLPSHMFYSFTQPIFITFIPSMFGAPEPLMENSRIRAVLAFARVVRDTSNTKDALTAANALLAGTLMDKEPEEVENAVRQIVERAEMIRSAGDQKSLFLSYIDEISLEDEAVAHFREGLDTKDYEEIIDYCRDFSLYGDGVEYRRTDSYPGVELVTAHSSKGLEWPIIYNTITRYQKSAVMRTVDVSKGWNYLPV